MLTVTFDPANLTLVKSILREHNQESKHINGNHITLPDQEDVVNLIVALKQRGIYASAA